MAASRFDLSRCLRILITTLYVASRLEKPVIPISAGTCPTAMLMADPVMNAEIAASEMKSTIHPARTRPMATITTPQMTPKDEATT